MASFAGGGPWASSGTGDGRTGPPRGRAGAAPPVGEPTSRHPAKETTNEASAATQAESRPPPCAREHELVMPSRLQTACQSAPSGVRLARGGCLPRGHLHAGTGEGLGVEGEARILKGGFAVGVRSHDDHVGHGLGGLHLAHERLCLSIPATNDPMTFEIFPVHHRASGANGVRHYGAHGAGDGREHGEPRRDEEADGGAPSPGQGRHRDGLPRDHGEERGREGERGRAEARVLVPFEDVERHTPDEERESRHETHTEQVTLVQSVVAANVETRCVE